MIMKFPKHKTFHYVPRYYDPMKDEEERRKRRLKFHPSVHRKSPRSILITLVLLALIIIVYFTLAQ